MKMGKLEYRGLNNNDKINYKMDNICIDNYGDMLFPRVEGW